MTEPEENEAPTEEHIDVDFEPEEDLGDIGAAKAKLKKMKDELAQAKKERQEYLDGWQRCKADSVNAKKDLATQAARTSELLRENLIIDIVPVLDSFDLATGSAQWETLDASWRAGMEHVRNQLITALETHGVQRYGKVGDVFDPQLHEAIEETKDGDIAQHMIVKIVRAGYRTHDRVLRPAQCVVKA